MGTITIGHLGPGWAEQPGDTHVWHRSQQIPDEELWRTHERRREHLVGFARKRLALQLRLRGAGFQEVAAAEQALDPNALTIGFGRRFATYKRATLLFRDVERLERSSTGRLAESLRAHLVTSRAERSARSSSSRVRRARSASCFSDFEQIVAR
jgi:starch phosphorylase